MLIYVSAQFDCCEVERWPVVKRQAVGSKPDLIHVIGPAWHADATDPVEPAY